MTNPNDPAYPIDPDKQSHQSAVSGWILGGLTKREYFAAMAMSGILSHPGLGREVEMERIAAKCIDQADALIAELNKSGK